MSNIYDFGGNSDTNQSPRSLQPNEPNRGIENAPVSSASAGGDQTPPLEVPQENHTPQEIPAKS